MVDNGEQPKQPGIVRMRSGHSEIIGSGGRATEAAVLAAKQLKEKAEATIKKEFSKGNGDAANLAQIRREISRYKAVRKITPKG